jgi:rhodanese-related sulfurtransferase
VDRVDIGTPRRQARAAGQSYGAARGRAALDERRTVTHGPPRQQHPPSLPWERRDGREQRPGPGGVAVASQEELYGAIRAGRVAVVDARQAAAYRRRRLPGAVNLAAEDPEAVAARLLPDRDAAIVVYSTDAACDRGEALVRRMQARGYGNVRLYRDGIEAWVQAGLEVEVDDGEPHSQWGSFVGG